MIGFTATALLASPAAAQVSRQTEVPLMPLPTAPLMGPVLQGCFTAPGVKFCPPKEPGGAPTVWLDPKAEPRDVARRLVEALVAMGFREE